MATFNSPSAYIMKIVSLSGKLDIMLFDQNINKKWILKDQNEIINIVERKISGIHDEMYKNIIVLHHNKQYNEAHTLLTHTQVLLTMFDDIINLTKKYYMNIITRQKVIECFSTDNV